MLTRPPFTWNVRQMAIFPAPDDELWGALSTARPRAEYREKRAGGIHIWGTLGVDYFLRSNGELVEFEWRNGNDTDGTWRLVTERPLALTVVRVARRILPELSRLLPNHVGAPCGGCSDLVDRMGVLLVCAVCEGSGVRSA